MHRHAKVVRRVPDDGIPGPRLFLASRKSPLETLVVEKEEIRALSDEARQMDSQPGLLVRFGDGQEQFERDWALIPFALFEQLLEKTQK